MFNKKSRTPTGQSYNIDFSSILNVPNDQGQRDRLIEEIPTMLKKLSNVKDLMTALGPLVKESSLENIQWTDDGVKQVTIKSKITFMDE